MSLKDRLLVGAVGASCVIAVVRALSSGEFNLGGGWVANIHVSRADDPGVFGSGVVLLLALAGICAVYLWRRRRE